MRYRRPMGMPARQWHQIRHSRLRWFWFRLWHRP